MELALICLASLLAGGIDSIVGGGGLILVPALFAVYPSAAPATLFGTNKSASVWGTSIATVQYARRVQMRWAVMLPAAGAALVGSFIGAWVVTLIDPTFLRRLLPFILLGLLLYTLAKKDLGRHHAPRFTGRAEMAATGAVGVLIGVYDGFFGPGAGSFLIFLFVRFFGFDFLHASAGAKVINGVTNLAALAYFLPNGHVLPLLAAAMAVANLGGSLAGTWLALKHGSGFIRRIFLLLAAVLIVKFAWDTLAPFL